MAAEGSPLKIRALALVVLAVILFGTFFFLKPFKKFWQQHHPVAVAPLVKVTAAEVLQKDVDIYGEWVGTTLGYIDAQIRPKVQGYLLAQSYTNGTLVSKGQLLFIIDPRQFEASLAQAIAKQHEAEATLEKYNIDVRRFTPLAAEGAMSQQELDQAVQNQIASKAALDFAIASVQQAQLNLDWTKVTSPIDGIAGINVTQIGDLVGEVNILTTVSRVDPIKVQFNISEQEYLALVHKTRITGSADVEEQVKHDAIAITLANGHVYPFYGRAISIDREVDIKMGTIRVQAVFPNPHNLLRPGQYAKVTAIIDKEKNAILVPQRAVKDVQGQSIVYVLDAQNKVSTRPVQTGSRIGDLWVITSGLAPKDRVVVEGLQKIRDGMTVQPELEPIAMPQEKKMSLISTNINLP